MSEDSTSSVMVFPVKVLLLLEERRETPTPGQNTIQLQHARFENTMKNSERNENAVLLSRARCSRSSARKRDERNLSSSLIKAPARERIYAQKEDKRPERKTTPTRRLNVKKRHINVHEDLHDEMRLISNKT